MSEFDAETVIETAINYRRALKKSAEDAALASKIAADSYARLGRSGMAADAYTFGEEYTKLAHNLRDEDCRGQ